MIRAGNTELLKQSISILDDVLFSHDSQGILPEKLAPLTSCIDLYNKLCTLKRSLMEISTGDLSCRISMKGPTAIFIRSIQSQLRNLKELTREQEHKIRETQKLLDHIDTGYLMINKELVVSYPYSKKACELFFNRKIADLPFLDLIFPDNDKMSKEREELGLYLQILFSNQSADEELLSYANPLKNKMITIADPSKCEEDRVVLVLFRRILKENQVEKILVEIENKKHVLEQKKEQEKESARKAQENEIITAILQQGPQLFFDFIQENRTALDQDIEILEKVSDQESLKMLFAHLQSLGLAFNKMTENLALANATLKDNELKYRLLADNIRDIIWTIDKDRKIMYVSPSVSTIPGFTQETVLGKAIEEVFTAKCYEMLCHKLQRALFSRDEQKAEELLEVVGVETEGHETMWLETHISPLFDENKNKTGVIAVSRNITDRKRLQDELLLLSTTDPLTGACNRRSFMEICRREVDRSRRYGQRLVLCLIDIDNFKLVNDTFGHAGGDKVICQLVETGKGIIRNTDVIARLGGDEFAILYTETNPKGAFLAAERLRKECEQFRLEMGVEKKLSFTISMGLAGFPSDRNPGYSIEELFQTADKALYQSKEAGRNRVSEIDSDNF